MNIHKKLLLDFSSGSNVLVPYRHYRMMITARNLSNAITVGEWELYDSSNVNRALGKTASASDQGFGNASAAFDGIVPANLSQPRWQTNTQTNPQWLAVDLGAEYLITRAVLYCDTSQIPNYAQYSPNTWYFQGSLDATSWKDILQVTGYTTALWSAKRAHEWRFI